VEPYIGQAQGVIEGDWVEAAEERQIGPPVAGRILPAKTPPAGAAVAAAPAAMDPFAPNSPGMVLLPGEAPPPVAPVAVEPVAVARARTIPAMLFVAVLLLGGAAELLTMRAGVVAARWVLVVSILLQGGLAVAVLVQNFQGMRNLAIVMLAVTGIWYYSVQITASVAIGLENGRRHDRTMSVNLQENQLAFTRFPWARGSAGVINLLLGLAGAIILLRGDRSNEPVSFNV
jgi:hypothetical protein